MKDQIKDPFMLFLVFALVGAIYVVRRTIRVVITLSPMVWRQARYNAGIAWQVYQGRNIRFVYATDLKVNNYHTRYEGTERAAHDEEA